jgi:2-keto-3-deoxy-L-fuconate dehydrogenase
MAGRLTGKTALVTAAAAGIGRAIAAAFVAEGAKVWATDLDAEKLAGLEGAERRKLDVTSNDAVAALARETGPVDILVNAAGFVHHGTVLDTDDKAWEFSFDINVKSMHRTIKAYLPACWRRAPARSSTSPPAPARCAASRTATPTAPPRPAVIGLTKAVAADYIKRGIRANAICPGTIQSPSLDQRIADQAKASGQSLQAVRQAFIDRQPMGRLGTPEEIAWLAVYLASDESSYTTGQIHLADGGFAL